LSVLVIPVALWGLSLDRKMVVMETTITTIKADHQKDIDRLEQDLKDAKNINKDVKANNDALIKLATQMEGVSGYLKDIKELLYVRPR